jgi:hypothetical protein
MRHRLSSWMAGATAAAVLALSGCATPYQSRGYGGGFQEREVGQNRWYVEFFGNGHTSRDTVTGFWLYRCAELTAQKGFDYFVILAKRPAPGASLEGEARFVRTSTGEDQGGFLRTRGGGGSSVPVYVPAGTITTWSSRGVIELRKGDPELDDRPTFLARDVLAKLEGPVRQASASGKNMVLPSNLFARPERQTVPTSGGADSGVKLRDLDGLLPTQ